MCVRQVRGAPLSQGALAGPDRPEGPPPPLSRVPITSPTQDDVVRYDALLMQRNLNTMPDLRYCPKCSIPGFLGKAGCGEAECSEPQCRFRFCTTCMLAPHSALRCSVVRVRRSIALTASYSVSCVLHSLRG